MTTDTASKQLDLAQFAGITPGPWRVSPPSVGRYKIQTAEGGKILGEASGYCADADANACLIAAAPALLSECRRLQAALDTQCEWSAAQDRERKRLQAENERLRGALEDLVSRCDGEEGVRADGSNIQTIAAHAILAKIGEE